MWFIRRMLKASWTARKTSERVLKEADTEYNLLDRIRTQQAKFVGHVMRGTRPYNWEDERKESERYTEKKGMDMWRQRDRPDCEM